MSKDGGFLSKILGRRDNPRSDLGLTNMHYLEEVDKDALQIFKKEYCFKDVPVDADKIAGIRKTRKEVVEKKQAEEDKLDDWYGMEKQTITPEVRDDLMALRLRQHLNPKQFYKTADSKKLPKYFQMGTVVDGPFSKGLKRKERKARVIQEFLKMDDDLAFSRRKFQDIQTSRQYKGMRKIIRARKLKQQSRRKKQT
eukprot:TRINITY_DN3935_c0_g1_i1.p1 TRINITY_DN3935_c0_g1~~TRINITY_DN3935_c0_g1_i1.p1  ORF type:complete len:197 (+),score=54.55 TRINITY_DN3935_c0_g1_i1:137-727(+)